MRGGDTHPEQEAGQNDSGRRGERHASPLSGLLGRLQAVPQTRQLPMANRLFNVALGHFGEEQGEADPQREKREP